MLLALECGLPLRQRELSDGEIEEVAQALQQRTVGSGEWAWVELNYRPHAYQAIPNDLHRRHFAVRHHYISATNIHTYELDGPATCRRQAT
jgi:hypothetical protein